MSWQAVWGQTKGLEKPSHKNSWAYSIAIFHKDPQRIALLTRNTLWEQRRPVAHAAMALL